MCCRWSQKISPDEPILLGGREVEKQAQQLLGQFTSVVRPLRVTNDTATVNTDRITRSHGTATVDKFRRVSSIKTLGEPIPGCKVCHFLIDPPFFKDLSLGHQHSLPEGHPQIIRQALERQSVLPCLTLSLLTKEMHQDAHDFIILLLDGSGLLSHLCKVIGHANPNCCAHHMEEAPQMCFWLHLPLVAGGNSLEQHGRKAW